MTSQTIPTYHRIVCLCSDDSLLPLYRAALAADYELSVTTDAADARQMLETAVPALLMLDGNLGGNGCYEVASQIRQDYSSADLPILLMSSLSGVEEFLTACAAGIDDVIGWPFEVMDLQFKVAQVMRRMQHSRQRMRETRFATDGHDELQVVNDFMLRALHCDSADELVERVLQTMARFRLSGTVQLVSGQSSACRSSGGSVGPLLEAVMGYLRSHGRLPPMGSSQLVASEGSAILVNNVRDVDPVSWQRLQRLLVVIAGAAAQRMQTLDQQRFLIAQRKLLAHSEIQSLQTLRQIEARYNVIRMGIQDMLSSMGMSIEAAYYDQALTVEQEAHFRSIVSEAQRQTTRLFDQWPEFGLEVQHATGGLEGPFASVRDGQSH